jgi:hypothetical protein
LSDKAVEYFDYRLRKSIEDGAENARVPIDWFKFGPLFLELFKDARYFVVGVEVPGTMLVDKVKKIEDAMDWDLTR